MSSDSESKLPNEQLRDIWTLPAISAVSIRRVRHERARQHTIAGRLVDFDEGVEIIIETDGQIPIRALAPALHIGAAELTESAQVDERTHRFFVLDESMLVSGEQILLGWVGHRVQATQPGEYRYEAPAGAPQVARSLRKPRNPRK